MPHLGIFRGLFTTNAVGTAHPDTDLWPPRQSRCRLFGPYSVSVSRKESAPLGAVPLEWSFW